MPYSPRNIRIACDHAGLTHFGGVYFFHEFLRVLRLRHFLATHLTYPRRNNRYHLSQMILALVYPIVLGLDRLETASFLRSNGTFQYLTGLPSFPDPQTLRRFLLHAPDLFWEQMHRVNDDGGSQAPPSHSSASFQPCQPKCGRLDTAHFLTSLTMRTINKIRTDTPISKPTIHVGHMCIATSLNPESPSFWLSASSVPIPVAEVAAANRCSRRPDDHRRTVSGNLEMSTR